MLRKIAVAFFLVGMCAAQDNVSRMEQVVQSHLSSKQYMKGKPLSKRACYCAGARTACPGAIPDLSWPLPTITVPFTTTYRIPSE